jgi:hypothetical protein
MSRLEPNAPEFLPNRKEFFNIFWFPVFDKAKELGLTDAEAEHTTELIFAALFRDGRLDGRLSLKEQMLELIRASVWLEIRRRQARVAHASTEASTVPRGPGYYLPGMIHQRLAQTLRRFWAEPISG